MSYDVAIWDGEQPKSDDDALEVFEQMAAVYDAETDETPSAALLLFIRDLTDRYPDLTTLPDNEVDDSPWADGPLVNNVTGRFLYLALAFAKTEEVLGFIAETARKYDLVCFDPQTETLL